jgi:hypothetical protein
MLVSDKDMFGNLIEPVEAGSKKKPVVKPGVKKAPAKKAEVAPPAVEPAAPIEEAPVAVAVPAPVIEEPAPVAKAKSALKPGWKTIIIDESEGEANYVFVGHNGTHYQLQRGVEVDVPPGVLDALSHAVATRYVSVVNPVTQQREAQARNFLRYPFRVTRG